VHDDLCYAIELVEISHRWFISTTISSVRVIGVVALNTILRSNMFQLADAVKKKPGY
jgi:hypothetical protein